MSNFLPDPTAVADKPPAPIPAHILLAMVHTLPRPAADAPVTAWQAVVQGGLDKLAALGPRDPIEVMLAIQVIAANAGALDAYRFAFEPDTTAIQARQQRANASALNRSVTGGLRLLAQRQKQPAALACDWGDAAVELGETWQQAPVRPAGPSRGGKAAEAEPEEIICWLDEASDEEVAADDERKRKEAAGEPPLPLPPGPRRIYKHKPGDYALTWKGPEKQSFEKYPGWENMTKPERRAYFGYTYTGPGCPISMLSPASQAAHAAGEE